MRHGPQVFVKKAHKDSDPVHVTVPIQRETPSQRKARFKAYTDPDIRTVKKSGGINYVKDVTKGWQ